MGQSEGYLRACGEDECLTVRERPWQERGRWWRWVVMVVTTLRVVRRWGMSVNKYWPPVSHSRPAPQRRIPLAHARPSAASGKVGAPSAYLTHKMQGIFIKYIFPGSTMDCFIDNAIDASENPSCQGLQLQFYGYYLFYSPLYCTGHDTCPSSAVLATDTSRVSTHTYDRERKNVSTRMWLRVTPTTSLAPPLLQAPGPLWGNGG